MADVVPISAQLRTSREALLRARLEAHNRGDIPAVIAMFSEPRLEVIPSGRVYDGSDRIRAHLEESRRTFPDQRFDPISLHHSDDAVIVEYWMSGTHLGEVAHVAPSGKRFRVRMVSIFEFAGDRLINQRVYFDAATIARQLA